MKVYHGTTSDKIRPILLQGFLPNTFFTTEQDYAREFAIYNAMRRSPVYLDGRVLTLNEALTHKKTPMVIEADIPEDALQYTGDFRAFGWGSPLSGPGNYEKLKNNGLNYRLIRQIKPKIRFIRVFPKHT